MRARCTRRLSSATPISPRRGHTSVDVIASSASTSSRRPAATIERKKRKRNFRQLWVARISAATRQHGLTYSRFMNALKKAKVLLDRKALSELAIKDPSGFEQLVALARQHVATA